MLLILASDIQNPSPVIHHQHPMLLRFVFACIFCLTGTALSAQATNDNCATALLIPVNADNTCNNTISGSTKDATPDPSLPVLCGDQSTDVWYRFVATRAAHLIRVYDVSNTTTQSFEYFSMEVYDANCTTYPLLSCEYNRYDNAALRQGELVPGNSYLIRVLTVAQPCTFKVCVRELDQQPPANDACAQALVLTVNTSENCVNFVSGNTKDATPSPISYCNTCGHDADVW
jgi:hypothetical protein